MAPNDDMLRERVRTWRRFVSLIVVVAVLVVIIILGGMLFLV